MYDPHNRWLVFLLCLNAVLLSAVIVSHAPGPQAYAQVAGVGADYILVPGKLRYSQQIVWVVSPSNSLLTNCVFDINRQSLEFAEVVDMSDDFSREELGEDQFETGTERVRPSRSAKPANAARRPRL